MGVRSERVRLLFEKRFGRSILSIKEQAKEARYESFSSSAYLVRLRPHAGPGRLWHRSHHHSARRDCHPDGNAVSHFHAHAQRSARSPGPSGSFCRFDLNGNLAVTIKNQGTAPAGPSITSIKISGQFSSSLGSGAFGGTYTGMTPAIPASQSADVSINVLVTGGTIVSATLTITADSTQQVTESNKNNNTVMATC